MVLSGFLSPVLFSCETPTICTHTCVCVPVSSKLYFNWLKLAVHITMLIFMKPCHHLVMMKLILTVTIGDSLGSAPGAKPSS